jgi:hypothetical protein
VALCFQLSARCVLKHGGTETQSLFQPYLFLLLRLSVSSVALCFQYVRALFFETQRRRDTEGGEAK